jgi:hypothetical protein
MVTYPFHPLVGQTVLITGVHEHDGVCHYLIRQSDGGHFHLPDWMIDPAAGQIETVAVPRLPVSQLLQLRHLVDHLLAYSANTTDGSHGEASATRTIGERQRRSGR